VLLVSAALAASIDEPMMERLRDKIAPKVESAVGRKRIEMPPVRIETRREVERRLLAKYTRRLARLGSADPGDGEAATTMIATLLDGAFAIYEGDARTISVIECHRPG
jgi:hypothetical protein